jgi:4-diphosphocytidyl-2-C-methyl-D-erythritol kinase
MLWGLGLARDALAGLAENLGSDVPFFLRGGTSLARGRGEQLTELPGLGGHWVVVAVPPLTIPRKTRSLYAALSEADFTDGSATLRLAEGLRRGNGLDYGALTNAFERAAFAGYPAIAGHRQAMLAAGAPFVRLSGSGPALYTLVERAAVGRSLCRRLRDEGVACHLARFQGNTGAPIAGRSI